MIDPHLVETFCELVNVLKVISFGVLFGTFCDYFQMGEGTVRQAVLKLARRVLKNEEIKEKYLRKLIKVCLGI